MYFNDFELWGKYLLFASLKKMIKNPSKLDEAAHRFACHPDDLSDLERFWNRDSYNEILTDGYIRFDEDRGWIISDDPEEAISWWEDVIFSRERTVGFDKLVQKMALNPEAVTHTRFIMSLYQEAVDTDIVWNKKKTMIGGKIPTMSFIVDEEIWKLLNLTDDICVQRALLRDFFKMNPAHASTIRRFLTDGLFTDSVLCFLGFATGSRLTNWSPVTYNLKHVISGFNTNALSMGCRPLSKEDVCNILDIMEDTIDVGYNSVPETLPGLQSIFAAWSVLNGCSVWNPGVSFLDVLPLIPPSIPLNRETLVWFSTYNEQVILALEILDRLSRSFYHERYIEVLIALVIYSEPFPPELLDKILTYLFRKDLKERVYEKYTYLALMNSKNMGEAVRMYVFSMLRF